MISKLVPLTVRLQPISQLEKQKQRGQRGLEGVNQSTGLPPHTRTQGCNYALLELRNKKGNKATQIRLQLSQF